MKILGISANVKHNDVYVIAIILYTRAADIQLVGFESPLAREPSKIYYTLLETGKLGLYKAKCYGFCQAP